MPKIKISRHSFERSWGEQPTEEKTKTNTTPKQTTDTPEPAVSTAQTAC